MPIDVAARCCFDGGGQLAHARQGGEQSGGCCCSIMGGGGGVLLHPPRRHFEQCRAPSAVDDHLGRRRFVQRCGHGSRAPHGTAWRSIINVDTAPPTTTTNTNTNTSTTTTNAPLHAPAVFVVIVVGPSLVLVLVLVLMRELALIVPGAIVSAGYVAANVGFSVVAAAAAAAAVKEDGKETSSVEAVRGRGFADLTGVEESGEEVRGECKGLCLDARRDDPFPLEEEGHSEPSLVHVPFVALD
jgi:hypothetical protein